MITSIISEVLIVAYSIIGIILINNGVMTKNYNALSYLYGLIGIATILIIGMNCLLLFAPIKKEADKPVWPKKANHNENIIKKRKKRVFIGFAAAMFAAAFITVLIFISKYGHSGPNAADIAFGVAGIALASLIYFIFHIVGKLLFSSEKSL